MTRFLEDGKTLVMTKDERIKLILDNDWTWGIVQTYDLSTSFLHPFLDGRRCHRSRKDELDEAFRTVCENDDT
jgi:hypothetical protein